MLGNGTVVNPASQDTGESGVWVVFRSTGLGEYEDGPHVSAFSHYPDMKLK